jgi:hypothetical protein
LQCLAGHDEEKTLEVIGGDLVEDELDVQLVVQAERVVPDRAAEDQVEDL